MPVLFLHAEYDYVCETMQSRLAEPMRTDCSDLTEVVVQSGHWMAQEQPALHFLYRMIANASAVFDREELRKRIAAMTTRRPDELRGFSMPTLFITGEEDTATFPTFIAEALAPMMPNAPATPLPR